MQFADSDTCREGSDSGDSAETRQGETRTQATEEALAAARRERDAAQAAAERMAAEATAILERLQGNQAAFDQMLERLSAAARRRMASEDMTADAGLAEELEDARAEAEAYRAQLEEERARMARELAQAHAERELAETELESLRAERGNLTVALEAARGRIGAMEKELDKTRKQMSLRTAELDALRRAAAQQVAAAQVQAGELEQRLAHAETVLEALRQTCRATDSSLQRQAAGLLEAADVLKALADRHALMKNAGLEQTPSAVRADRQEFLFAANEDSNQSPEDEADILPSDDTPTPPSSQQEQLRAIAQQVLRDTPPETPHEH